MDNLRLKFILGKKIGMMTIFKENEFVPVTVIEAGPCQVLDIKEKNDSGYARVKLGFEKNKKNKFNFIKEFRLPVNVDLKKGDEVKVDFFQEGDRVNIVSRKKAKGFAGVVKRHGFSGGPRTHGQEDRERHPGSIGQRWPQRVRKGLKMAGRISPKRVNIKNLEVVKIIPEKNLILIKGSIPGPRKTLVEIKSNIISNKGNFYFAYSKDIKKQEIKN